MADRLSPTDALQARGLLADAALAGQSVRFVGAGTKLSWGGAAVASDLELTTERLDRVVEHNAGDLTAVLEAAAPLELEALDFAWLDGRGRLLAQCGGPRAVPRAEHACNMMRDLGLGECQVDLDDEKLWEHQRARQRCREAALVRVSVPPSRL